MPRPYVQRTRARTVEQTRRRVLDAARGVLLAERGLEFGMSEIAASAGVARSTIYATFGSRAGLVAGLADDTLQRAGLAEVIAEYRRSDAVSALELSLRANCRMYAVDHRVFARLLILAQVDPDAAGPLARWQADRAAGMADLARRLADQARLRSDVSVERAADVLWLLTGFWAFDELFSGRGLDANACAETVIDIARSTLLRGAKLRRPGPTPI